MTVKLLINQVYLLRFMLHSGCHFLTVEIDKLELGSYAFE